jgi:hypothetical protein
LHGVTGIGVGRSPRLGKRSFAIKPEIEASLQRRSIADDEHVSVTDEDALVRSSGTVTNWWQRGMGRWAFLD